MDKLEFSIASEIGNIVKVENFIDYFSDVYNVEPDVFGKISLCAVSYTHLTLPTKLEV